MNNDGNLSLLSAIFEHFGWTALVAVIALLLVFWVLVHLVAEPGKPVTYLGGVVSYTKRPNRPTRRKRRKPIDVVEPLSGTIWRVLRPVDEWIDQDISSFDQHDVENLLDGPHHEECKADLSYFESSYNSSGWRIRSICTTCEKEILPNDAGKGVGDRLNFKRFVLQQMKRRHLQRKKIKQGTRLD
jgi:hypothetical protein